MAWAAHFEPIESRPSGVTQSYNYAAPENKRSTCILYNDSRCDVPRLLIGADSPNQQAAMKLLPSLATLSLTLLSVSTPAIGQQEVQRGREFAKGPSQGEMQRSFLRRNEPSRIEGKNEQSLPRESSTAQRPDDLKPVPGPGLVPVQGRERLSPEERKQLRRDIHAAGRDIYRRQRPD